MQPFLFFLASFSNENCVVALPVLQRWEVEAVGDANMRKLQKGEVLQLERKGYFIIDQPHLKGKPMVLFAIPDGRQKAIIPSPS